jgi:hypothetical protein
MKGLSGTTVAGALATCVCHCDRVVLCRSHKLIHLLLSKVIHSLNRLCERNEPVHSYLERETHLQHGSILMSRGGSIPVSAIGLCPA